MRWGALYLIAGGALLSVFSPMTVVAQVAPPPQVEEAAREETRRQEAARSQEEAARRAARRARDGSDQPQTGARDPLAPKPGGPCFELKDIILKGFEAVGDEPKGFRQLIGTCATAADIGKALNQINKHYQDKGYITTRAYVPEQDLADGSLEITVVPGRIEGFVYENGAKADKRIDAAFPTSEGDVLYLRDLEQGLDNINAPRSTKGWFKLLPGEAPGGSVVQIKTEDTLPFHLDLSANNQGYETTGVYQASATLGADNLLGLNDQLRIEIGSTPFDARDKRYSDSISASWTAPIGYWSIAADIGASRYFFILDGINQSYPVEGRSHYATASLERLLLRDQTTKLFAYSDLKLSRTRTFIDGFEIESQRRNLTIGALGLRGEQKFEKGRLNWDVGAKFGLDAFDSYVLDKSIVDPEFRLVAARIDFEHALWDTGVTYKGVLAGRHSDDILPSTEQFSIGGWSTVRGFHADNMYGDSGVYLRNTLDWAAFKNETFDLHLMAGLDIGYVAPSTLRSWSQDHIAGASIGASLKLLDAASLTAQAGYALSRPEENPPNAQPAFEDNKFVGSIELKLGL